MKIKSNVHPFSQFEAFIMNETVMVGKGIGLEL